MNNVQKMLNNDLEDFGFLDALGLWSVYAQYKGIKDAKGDRDLNSVILKIISAEINKLHQEDADIFNQNVEIIEQNKKIIEQNDELLMLLRGENDARKKG